MSATNNLLSSDVLGKSPLLGLKSPYIRKMGFCLKNSAGAFNRERVESFSGSLLYDSHPLSDAAEEIVRNRASMAGDFLYRQPLTP